MCEVQPRSIPVRINNSTRVPINIIRSTTPRSSFSTYIMRPTRTPQNIPYKSSLIQQSGIAPY